MSACETVVVPFVQVGNRQCLTMQQIAENEWLVEFVERFRHCFEEDTLRGVLWFYPGPETGRGPPKEQKPDERQGET